MRRLLKYTAGLILFSCAALALLVAASYTSYGTQQLLRVATWYASKQGTTIEIEDSSGNLWSGLSVTRVSIQRPEDLPITLEQLELRLSPYVILSQSSWFQAQRGISLDIMTVEYGPLSFQVTSSEDETGRVTLAAQRLGARQSIELSTAGGQSTFVQLNLNALIEEEAPHAPRLTASFTLEEQGHTLLFHGTLDALQKEEMAARCKIDGRLEGDRSLQATIDVDGSLGSLSALHPLPGHLLRGTLQGAAKLTGTLFSPQVEGHISVQDINYRNALLGTQLSSGRLELELSDADIEIDFSAQTENTGSLALHGTIDLSQNEPALAFALDLKEGLIVDRPDAQAIASAQLALSGTSSALKASGNLITHNVELKEPEMSGPSIPEINVVRDDTSNNRSLAPELALALTVSMPDRVFLRARGLESELGGQLEISGTAADPLVHGQLHTIRGWHDLLGHRFEISTGTVVLYGKDISADLEAKTRADDLLVTLNVRSDGHTVDVDLSSQPEYPSDEIIARLLFGKSSASLSPMQAAQLALAVRQLQGGSGAFDPIGQARRALGLNYLDIGGSEAGGVKLGAGLYVMDGVFLGVEQETSTQETKAQVRIKLSEELSIEANKGGEDSPDSLSITWEHKY